MFHRAQAGRALALPGAGQGHPGGGPDKSPAPARAACGWDHRQRIRRPAYLRHAAPGASGGVVVRPCPPRRPCAPTWPPCASMTDTRPSRPTLLLGRRTGRSSAGPTCWAAHRPMDSLLGRKMQRLDPVSPRRQCAGTTLVPGTRAEHGRHPGGHQHPPPRRACQHRPGPPAHRAKPRTRVPAATTAGNGK